MGQKIREGKMKGTTCIVGWIKESPNSTVIYMGADGQITSGYQKANGFDKLFENGNFLMGVTGDVYAANLLKYTWEPPDQKVMQNDMFYLQNEVIPSIRKLFKDYGHSTVNNNREMITEKTLLAYNKKLYIIYTDFCLVQSPRPFDAIGCGEEYALGACHILYRNNKSADIEEKIRRAILAADEFSIGVDNKIIIKKKVWKK